MPFFARPDVAAVVVPSVTPPDASLRERAAAAVLESRLGGGSRRSAYLPGNVGITTDDAGGSLVVRRADWERAVAAGVPPDGVVSWLAERGRRTVYTPDAIVAAAAEPLFGPHLRETLRRGRIRGAAARRTRGRSVSAATLLSVLPLAAGAVGLVLLARRCPRRRGAPRRSGPGDPRLGGARRRCGSSRCGSGSSPSPRSS